MWSDKVISSEQQNVIRPLKPSAKDFSANLSCFWDCAGPVAQHSIEYWSDILLYPRVRYSTKGTLGYLTAATSVGCNLSKP